MIRQVDDDKGRLKTSNTLKFDTLEFDTLELIL